MNHRDHQMPACDRFDELLPDFLEGSLPAGARQEAERHRATCARCAALVADLQGIARSAAALPRLHPERDLWAGIAERIEPAVVPLDARRAAAAPTPHRTYTFTRRWLGAAAAALVVVTSGVTYLAVRPDRDATNGGAPAAPRVASADAAAPSTPDPLAPPSTETAAPSVAEPSVAEPSGGEPRVAAAREASPEPARAADARLASGTAADAALAAATETYDREIASLRAIVARRRPELDSSIVAVLERNLRIIDQAIAQSRAALAGDPSSQFLGEQLTRALDSKVELLRTAALLPQRGA